VLRDSAKHVLVRPYDLFRDQSGIVYVVDISDRDIKRFDAAGKRSGSYGYSGAGKGFGAVKTVGRLKGNLVAYDMSVEKMCQLEPHTASGSSLDCPTTIGGLSGSRPIRATVVDDSLLVITHTCLEGAKDPLVTLTDATGKVLARLFQPRSYLGDEVKLWNLTDAVVDARGGTIFAGLIGSDSIWAFDYRGRQIGRGVIGGLNSAVTTKALLAGNRGEPQTPDKRWVIDGQWRAIRIVALDHRRALVQLSKLSATQGVNLLDGGRVAVVEVDSSGAIRTLANTIASGGLMGRDSNGGLLLRRSRESAGDFELWRITINDR
jgi:hypothetical protein